MKRVKIIRSMFQNLDGGMWTGTGDVVKEENGLVAVINLNPPIPLPNGKSFDRWTFDDYECEEISAMSHEITVSIRELLEPAIAHFDDDRFTDKDWDDYAGLIKRVFDIDRSAAMYLITKAWKLPNFIPRPELDYCFVFILTRQGHLYWDDIQDKLLEEGIVS